MKCKQLALRVLSTAAILSIVSSIAAPVFAETYYIGNGYDLSIEAKEDGKVYVNGHEDQDGEITIKGSAGKDSLTEEKKEQETGENSGAEKQTVTEETPKEKTSAEEGETKKQDTPSENSDEENEGKDPANENKKDDAPAAEENDPQPEDTAEPEEKAVKKEAADSGENAPAALQSTAAAKSAPEKNTSVEKSPVSNVIKVVNNWADNWADKILKITLDNVNIKADKAAMSISGSGNVAIFACEKATALGAKVVAMSDSNGYIHDPDGIKLDIIKDIKLVKRGRIKEYAAQVPGSTYTEGFRGIWTIPCDIALPCATQNEITAAEAEEIVKGGAMAVAEGANMPSTPEAIAIFQKAGLLFAPAKAANAGGVAVSALEMSQNSMRYSWTFEEVDAKLQGIMVNIFHNINNAAKEYGMEGNLVAGANLAGFKKVSEAMIAQGVV